MGSASCSNLRLRKFEGFDEPEPKKRGALGLNGSAQRRYLQENLVKQSSRYLKPHNGQSVYSHRQSLRVLRARGQGVGGSVSNACVVLHSL